MAFWRASVDADALQVRAVHAQVGALLASGTARSNDDDACMAAAAALLRDKLRPLVIENALSLANPLLAHERFMPSTDQPHMSLGVCLTHCAMAARATRAHGPPRAELDADTHTRQFYAAVRGVVAQLMVFGTLPDTTPSDLDDCMDIALAQCWECIECAPPTRVETTRVGVLLLWQSYVLLRALYAQTVGRALAFPGPSADAMGKRSIMMRWWLGQFTHAPDAEFKRAIQSFFIEDQGWPMVLDMPSLLGHHIEGIPTTSAALLRLVAGAMTRVSVFSNVDQLHTLTTAAVRAMLDDKSLHDARIGPVVLRQNDGMRDDWVGRANEVHFVASTMDRVLRAVAPGVFQKKRSNAQRARDEAPRTLNTTVIGSPAMVDLFRRIDASLEKKSSRRQVELENLSVRRLHAPRTKAALRWHEFLYTTADAAKVLQFMRDRDAAECVSHVLPRVVVLLDGYVFLTTRPDGVGDLYSRDVTLVTFMWLREVASLLALCDTVARMCEPILATLNDTDV